MTDLATVLRGSLDDEPPLGFAPEDVVRRGRRARARRRALLAGAASGAAAGAVALGLVVLPARAPSRSLTPTSPAPTLAPSASAAPLPARVTARNVAGFAEAVLGVRLHDVTVRDDLPLPPGARGGELFALFAAVEDPAGRGSISVSVAEPGGLTFPVTCASFVGALDGDGYEGDCAQRVLPGGATLVERDGRVPGAGYAMTMAVLVRPDGSGVVAQSTNQDTPAAVRLTAPPAPTPPPVTRSDPPVTSAELVRLVQAVAERTPSTT